ncbi:MAG: methylated-DNA--[protein]-cysteine S-methyltransferase [Victivallales bacterium]|nr:methylated-DNA--[protein]-cysteine S-methyltransferase [Victivallales bacterium]
MTMASDGEALVSLCFDGQRHFSSALPPGAVEGSLPVFNMTSRWLDMYFGGKEPDFMPPLNMQGTDFRQAVWKILLDIPYGKTMTYGEIAARLARERGLKAMSAQAVGGAVGHNPIAIIVPCHRVIGAAGKMVGYGGCIHRKIALLEIEGTKER